MIWLGIESSCDETACAVLKGKNQVLSNIVSSSLAKHKPFGGVVPEIASRHALEAIDIVYLEALRKAAAGNVQLTIWGDETQDPAYAAGLRSMAEGLDVRFAGTVAREGLAAAPVGAARARPAALPPQLGHGV